MLQKIHPSVILYSVLGIIFFSGILSPAQNSSIGDQKVSQKMIYVFGVPLNSIIPVKFTLSQNYPNPFNPTTNIRYSLQEGAHISIRVYDVLGKFVIELINGYKNTGTYEIKFDGSGVSSGIYYYQIASGDFTDTKAMVLVK